MTNPILDQHRFYAEGLTRCPAAPGCSAPGAADARPTAMNTETLTKGKLYKCLFILLFLTLWTGQTQAAPPAGRNLIKSFRYDLSQPSPRRLEIWTGEPSGYDIKDPQKWGRNTLTCTSRSISEYGACQTAPVYSTASGSGYISLDFRHTRSLKTVQIIVTSDHVMFFKNRNYALPAYATAGEDNQNWGGEPYFDFYINGKELKKLDQPGTWTATLKLNLRQWGTAPCGGDPNNPGVGCPGYPTVAFWQAMLTINVVDLGNQQIYLPEFQISPPIVDLNLAYSRRGPGVSEMRGERIVDMCLYDGVGENKIQASLRFEDEGGESHGRAGGAFSIRRQDGSQTDPRDRLDYQIRVTNPITGATEPVENGKTLIWHGFALRGKQRWVVLPGADRSILCTRAPFTLITPAFAASSKNAGDYTGTLRVIYTPGTQ